MKHHPASHNTAFCPQILTLPSDPEYTKLLTTKATVTNFFVDKILMTPKFQQMAAKQHSIAAQSASQTQIWLISNKMTKLKKMT
jgi:hypothetical protein